MLKRILPLSLFMLLIPAGFIFAADEATTAATRSVPGILSVLPLVLILVLLFLRVDMIVAGLAGGVLAMLLGGISIASGNDFLTKSLPMMLTLTVPIINSAIATAVFKSGGYVAALTLVRRAIRGKVEYLAAFIVILQAAATYMSGIGGGSAMVIAPLAFAALGAIPELIAAMAIAAAVSFTTSPASLESGIVSQLGGFAVQDHVATMRPFWLLFVALAIVLAFIGAKKRGALFQGEESEEIKSMTSKELWKHTIPAIFLLGSVILGPVINKAVGMPVLAPLVYLVLTTLLIWICTKFTLNQSFEALVDGSNYILTRLFGVGIFLAFINMIGDIGAFNTIAGVTSSVPDWLMVPVGVLAGFVIGVPAGAYVGSILTLVLPIAVSLHFSPISLGFVAMGVGFGAMVSFVNITMQALASGFKVPIIDVVKGNAKWVGASMVLLLTLSFFFT
ncbi:citrate transporter [Paenibacillus sp.]|uniref:citrate transporter n=1 Tax=Paenibacillus sp. TaxID=58172 RepID=UPI0028AC1FC1|nr:citrate transporter [Paenibacillus sp.]